MQSLFRNVLENSSIEYLTVRTTLFTNPDRQSEWAKKKLIWVPHEKEGFVSASIVEDNEEENTIVVEIVETGQRVQLRRNDYQKANPPKFDKVFLLFF